ncbi:MAG: energy transducer TonB [Bacteroidia bacterium]
MKKQLLIAIFIIISTFSFSQTDKQNIKIVTNTEPTFPKGDNELYQYVMMNVKYSEEAKKKYIQGEVTLSFDVRADSVVSNVVIISGVGYGVDEEVKKLVQSLKFAPAVQNGMTVKMNTMYTFPVKAH